jgi:hypothetical protein
MIKLSISKDYQFVWKISKGHGDFIVDNGWEVEPERAPSQISRMHRRLCACGKKKLFFGFLS